MLTSELTTYLNELLNISGFQDYCPNGLQVAGRSEIKKIITGVTASQALLDIAVQEQADAVLVHHGYFWKGENPCVVGIKRSRLATLLQHDINLLAYHLPLDAHPELGNNAELGRVLQFKVTDILNDGLLYVGELAAPLSAAALQQHITKQLRRESQVIAARQQDIKRVAWCTGAAQDMLETAAQLNVDAYLSGEISERTVHLAQEYGVDYFACGHHATERYGVQALGNHLAKKYPLEVKFVDLFNPV